MKVRTILLSMVLVAGVSLNVSAQFKIGGKSINTKKLVNAASERYQGRRSRSEF